MFSLGYTASQLLYSTVMIVATLSDGQLSFGTAFFYQIKIDDNRGIQLLVTNNHVIAGATSVELLLHESVNNKETGRKEPGPNSFKITVEAKDFVAHPDGVDLCAVPFGLLRLLASQNGKEIFFIPIGDEVIATDEQLRAMSALENVMMVGYPIGLSDTTNNLPLIRKGITASHPHANFKGKPVGVLDIASFPGSSGSPVLIHDDESYGLGDGLRVVGPRTLLLGILYGGPQYEADGSLEIREIPTARASRVPVVPIPIHLGFYIKAKELRSLKEAVFAALKLSSEH